MTVETVQTLFGPTQIIVNGDLPPNTFVLATQDSAVAAVWAGDGWQVIHLFREPKPGT